MKVLSRRDHKVDTLRAQLLTARVHWNHVRQDS
jgi:hypothetical protein